MFHGFRKFKKGHTIEIEDVSLDSVIQKRHKNSIIASQKKETTIGERAFVGLFFGFIFLMIALIAVCFYFQIVRADDFSEKAENNQYIFNEINTQRGVVYDNNFNQLVENKQIFTLLLGKGISDGSLNEVAKILDILPEDLISEIQSSEDEQVRLGYELNDKQVIILKTKISELDNVYLEKKSIREYEEGEAFSHLLGYVSKDEGVGEDGIESYYEDILKENPGIKKYERDAYGNILSEEVVEESSSGKSLVLNIDSVLQEKSAEVLEKVVENGEGTGGAVIIMNPQTGAILSLVSYPFYDNNFFSRNFTQEEYDNLLNSRKTSFFNRAISGEYPIGSTIKPLLATAFLEEDIIDPDTNIKCEGGIVLADGTTKHDWKVHGLTNMRKAIAESCDVYFYVLGGGYKDIDGLGIERIDEYLYKYGLGKTTGIDLPGEASGFIPDPEWKEGYFDLPWYPGDTYNMSIGQGYMKATPLQVLVATSAIANGGKLMKPEIVKGIVDDKKNIVELFAPEVIDNNFISPSSLQVAKEGMRQTVTSPDGSAYSFNTLPIDLSAKTGTAETGTGDTYHNWIVAFGPYENPDFAIIVTLEHVSNYSGLTQQVVREIVEFYYAEEEDIDKDSNN